MATVPQKGTQSFILDTTYPEHPDLQNTLALLLGVSETVSSRSVPILQETEKLTTEMLGRASNNTESQRHYSISFPCFLHREWSQFNAGLNTSLNQLISSFKSRPQVQSLQQVKNQPELDGTAFILFILSSTESKRWCRTGFPFSVVTMGSLLVFQTGLAALFF